MQDSGVMDKASEKPRKADAAMAYDYDGDAVAEPMRPGAEGRIDPARKCPQLPGYPPVGSVPVSVLVPTKNEEANLLECLARVQWADHITVIDSQSTDDTVLLAQANRAEVYQFHYDKSVGWPKKKNWALQHVPWRHEWVLIVDADEHITPQLAQEIKSVIEHGSERHGARPGCGDGYWINRRLMFLGRWLKYGGWYPSWNLRLFKHRLGRYERIGVLGDTGSGDNEVHEHPILLTGDAGYLEHAMDHYAYPDLSVWIEKHNRYTTWEAHARDAKDAGAIRAKLLGSTIERRRWLKKQSRRLPGRPIIRFVFDYIFRRGILDGYAGFVMAINMAWYEFMADAKYYELQRIQNSRKSSSEPRS